MAYEIRLDGAEARRVAKRVGKAAERDLPDAIQEALTTLAYRARKAEQKNLADVLDRPTPFTVQSVAAVKAQKKSGGYESRIFVQTALVDILERLEEGGSLPEGFGIVDKALTDQYGSLGVGAIARILSLPRTFEATIKNTHGIFRREEGGREIRLILAFESPVRYKPQLGYKQVAQDVAATFPAEVERQLRKRLEASKASA